MKSRNRGWAAGIAAVIVAAGITGCTPASIGTVSDQPVPEPMRSGLLQGSYAFADDGRLFVGLTGSSSCPSVPTKLVPGDDGDLGIGITKAWWPLCTADMQLVVYEIPVEELPDTVTLFDGDIRTTVDVG